MLASLNRGLRNPFWTKEALLRKPARAPYPQRASAWVRRPSQRAPATDRDNAVKLGTYKIQWKLAEEVEAVSWSPNWASSSWVSFPWLNLWLLLPMRGTLTSMGKQQQHLVERLYLQAVLKDTVFYSSGSSLPALSHSQQGQPVPRHGISGHLTQAFLLLRDRTTLPPEPHSQWFTQHMITYQGNIHYTILY